MTIKITIWKIAYFCNQLTELFNFVRFRMNTLVSGKLGVYGL